MWHTQDSRARLKSGRNLNGEVFVWLAELYTIVKALCVERASIKDASEDLDGTFTRVLRAMVEGNADADIG